MFDELIKEVAYAKTSIFKQRSLYYAYGRIKMAYELGAIALNEYLKLSSICVRDGINNPKYFD